MSSPVPIVLTPPSVVIDGRMVPGSVARVFLARPANAFLPSKYLPHVEAWLTRQATATKGHAR